MPEDNAPKRKPIWRREKVWFAVIIAAVPVVNELTGLDLGLETVLGVIAPFAALLGIEGFGDLVSRHHESRARRDAVNGGK